MGTGKKNSTGNDFLGVSLRTFAYSGNVYTKIALYGTLHHIHLLLWLCCPCAFPRAEEGRTRNIPGLPLWVGTVAAASRGLLLLPPLGGKLRDSALQGELTAPRGRECGALGLELRVQVCEQFVVGVGYRVTWQVPAHEGPQVLAKEWDFPGSCRCCSRVVLI